MSSAVSGDSGSRSFSYSRKEKSLGVLCSNFLSLYNRDDVVSVGVDDAASRLGVERRRIYDVVNILESVGVVARKAKNQYSWKGFGGIPSTLEELKEVGMRENFNISSCCNTEKVLNLNESEGSCLATVDGQENLSSSKTENRREKSLAQLTQNFIKLFLCSNVDLVTLDSAAVALLGDDRNSTAMRTKIRRLYDIANVLSSMNLLEKTHHPENRKPSFRWLGYRGNLNNGSATALDLNEPKKRVFGSDITNCSKRRKEDSQLDDRSNQKVTVAFHAKDNGLENNFDGKKSGKQLKHNAKGFEFGPFAPVVVARKGDSTNKDERQLQDWENLASTCRPQYHNQALTDLFAHYMEAWKSWYIEVSEKKHMQQIS